VGGIVLVRRLPGIPFVIQNSVTRLEKNCHPKRKEAGMTLVLFRLVCILRRVRVIFPAVASAL